MSFDSAKCLGMHVNVHFEEKESAVGRSGKKVYGVGGGGGGNSEQ